MALDIGRKGRLFVKKETTYGDTGISISAANAMRHINVQFQYDPYQRVTSPEKKLSPGPVNRFDRRTMASLSALECLLRPAGVINTVPECDPILEAGFGSKTNVALSTTVASGGTTSGATLTSTTGLVVGGAIWFTINSKKYVRIIATLPGANAVTVVPALPSAPANGSAVKSCLVYKLTTDLAISLYFAHYLTTFTRDLFGVGIDKLSLKFDGTEEARLTASGPGKNQRTPAQAQPGSFTEVGSNPPTGMVGQFMIDDTVYLHKSLDIDITNNVKTRNVEAGNDGLATEVYRAGRREIGISLECYAETEATLYDKAEAGTNVKVFRQNGFTEGNIVAVYMPRVEFKVSETSDGDEEVDWTFKAVALESADGQNDELFLVFG